jgi:hypothetical protein
MTGVGKDNWPDLPRHAMLLPLQPSLPSPILRINPVQEPKDRS